MLLMTNSHAIGLPVNLLFQDDCITKVSECDHTIFSYLVTLSELERFVWKL